MALFIGGPLDGRLIEVDPSREHIEVAIENTLGADGISINPQQKAAKSLTNVFYYKREILSCPTIVFAVFVPRSYTCNDVMTALIEGYHQSVTQLLPNQQ